MDPPSYGTASLYTCLLEKWLLQMRHAWAPGVLEWVDWCRRRWSRREKLRLHVEQLSFFDGWPEMAASAAGSSSVRELASVIAPGWYMSDGRARQGKAFLHRGNETWNGWVISARAFCNSPVVS